MKKLVITVFSLVLLTGNTEAKVCKTAQGCKDINNKCLCYCAFKPGYRNKTKKDKPIYFSANNDPYGKRCYCAQRDLDKLALEKKNK